ncbi:LuxR family transcriptional regulator [Nonomuraea diastatica]|uniref:LuxR family transcriptional regulator n=2 Tax=Nonomuraea diastatica TaxID=1848329 RepID=A0A4R4WSD3_9ACTN|nr:LuxR family transcriptional regulator [Nonomuraea diastatica]
MTRSQRYAEIVSAAERSADALELFGHASARLRRVVPFDGAVWSATDPETGLVTAPMQVENLGSAERCAVYWESELLEENVLPFRDLAHAAVPVGALRAATGDSPARSARFRRLLGDQGVDDELRAVLRTGGRPWGSVSLFRLRGAPPFGPDEIALLAGLSGPLAELLCRFAAQGGPDDGRGASAPGLLLFDEHGEATSINEEARGYLALLPDGPSTPSSLGLRLPIWLTSTALQARAIAQERDHGNARIRLRTRDGRWLTCRASCLSGPSGPTGGPVVLVIEPAAPADLAGIVAQAHGLTPREFEVARLVARGQPTADIAAVLFISPHTVRGHLKAIFSKMAVSSRGELIARLFAEEHRPPDVTGGP